MQPIRDENTVRDCIAHGLQYCCTSPQYRDSRWLKRQIPNGSGARDYLTRWYIPLIEKGFSLPFFMVLDLGLLFLIGQPSLQPPPSGGAAGKNKEQFQRDYYYWLYGMLSMPAFQSLTTMLERDRRRKKIMQDWNSYRAGRKAFAPKQSLIHAEASLFEAKFDAAPTFLEFCLGDIDANHTGQFIFHPDAFREPERFDSIWEDPPSNPIESPVLAEKMNRELASEMIKEFPQKENEPLTRLKQTLIRSHSLGAANLESTDLNLLGNYTQFYKLNKLIADSMTQETLPLKRARVLLPEKVRSREGGYHGIDYDGDWSSFVHSQLAIYMESKELFFNKYYNHKLLYYDRRQIQSRPPSILLAFFIDIGSAMRSKAEEEGYKNALAREISTFFIQDILRFVGWENLAALDIYVTCYRPGRVGPEFFLNAAEEKSSLSNIDDPLLTSIFKALDGFFFLDTAGADPASLGVGTDQEALKMAIEHFHKRMIDEFVLRTQQGQEAIGYDCVHLSLLTHPAHQIDPAALREEIGGAGFSARNQILNLFSLENSGVRWLTAKPADSKWNSTLDNPQPYQELRSGAESSLRVCFFKTVIRETLRYATQL